MSRNRPSNRRRNSARTLEIRPPDEVPIVRSIASEPHPNLHHVGRFHHFAKDGTRYSVEVHIRDIKYGGLESLQGANVLTDGFAISINVAARQLLHTALASDFIAVIERSNIAPRHFAFEITEASEVSGEGASMFVDSVRASGSRVMLDDFGTQYSSISYLHRYPFDAVKIDREFITAVAHRPDDYVIVEAITKLAHSLGMTVVAEGVMSFDQVLELRALGIDFLQGFLIAPPMPLFGLQRFLELGPQLGQAGSRYIREPSSHEDR